MKPQTKPYSFWATKSVNRRFLNNKKKVERRILRWWSLEIFGQDRKPIVVFLGLLPARREWITHFNSQHGRDKSLRWGADAISAVQSILCHRMSEPYTFIVSENLVFCFSFDRWQLHQAHFILFLSSSLPLLRFIAELRFRQPPTKRTRQGRPLLTETTTKQQLAHS